MNRQVERHYQSFCETSSSRMRVVNHNWSPAKRHLHPQSVAEISCHLILSGDRIRQCGTSSGSCHKDRSVSVSRHFLLQAPQRPCSVRKRFSSQFNATSSRFSETARVSWQVCIKMKVMIILLVENWNR